jgi:hypothetical protein
MHHSPPLIEKLFMEELFTKLKRTSASSQTAFCAMSALSACSCVNRSGKETVHLSTTGSAEPQDAQIPNASNIASITANLLPNRLDLRCKARNVVLRIDQ